MKQENIKHLRERVRAATADRDAQIMAQRAAGATMQTIADKFGLTRARVHQIIKRRNA